MSKEAMKLALEALRMPCNFWNKVQFIRVTEAAKALEEALAKQEQGEPVAQALEALEDLKSVLTDHEGNVCWQGSYSDRDIIGNALQEFEKFLAARPAKQVHGEPVTADEKLARMKSELAYMRGQQEQGEPVAWRAPNWSHSADDYVYRDFDDPVIGADGKPSPNNEPLYTTPQQRTWVGLTDDERRTIINDWQWQEGKPYHLCLSIEAKLKEKNT